MVWWWEEGKRFILWFLSKPFWEVRPAGMTDCPKEARLGGERWVHAIGREREHLRRGRRKCHGGLRNNKKTCLCLAKGSSTQMVVSKYAQTRQRPLEGKVVKINHGRTYKRILAMPCIGDRKTEEGKVEEKLKEKKKGKKQKIRKQRVRIIGMHQ